VKFAVSNFRSDSLRHGTSADCRQWLLDHVVIQQGCKVVPCAFEATFSSEKNYGFRRVNFTKNDRTTLQQGVLSSTEIIQLRYSLHTVHVTLSPK
jgi:hypothetical protein